MASYLTTGSPVPYRQPDYHDFELAIRFIEGAELRPGELAQVQVPSPALVEAIHRTKHCLSSQIEASRQCLLALMPDVIQAYGDLLQSPNERVRLDTAKAVSALVLPQRPVEIDVRHGIATEDRQLVGQAAADFHRLTNELVDQLKEARAAKTIDITRSKHVLRGTDARPQPGALERPEQLDGLP